MKKFLSVLSLVSFAGIIFADEIISSKNSSALFSGKDFSGLTFCMKNDADPMQTWSATNGVIHCNGAAVGYLRTKEVFQNYTLTVEWRFLKMAPKADNTGVMVHMQLPDQVWPMCVQVQGKHEHQGDLFLMAGAESNEHKGKDANTALPLRGDSAEKNIGEWNSSVTLCSNDVVRAYINGRLMNETAGCTVTNGFIGIQSEGADFEIRKMVLEPLRQPSEFFRVITDGQTGQYAVVNPYREVVTLKDKNGSNIWSTNVVKSLKTMPFTGERKISSLQLFENKLLVFVGKDAFTITIQTGETIYLGAN